MILCSKSYTYNCTYNLLLSGFVVLETIILFLGRPLSELVIAESSSSLEEDMFRQVDDFLKGYENLNEGSMKVFAKLTDQNLNQSVAEGHRTLGQVAWHIVTSVPEMMNHTGLGLSSVNHEAPPPTTAAEIIEAYKKASEELLASLKAKWNDETLLEMDNLYGEQWPRGLTLAILMSHEVHHRGQMTVLLRKAGSGVPGVMGPSKEEWKQIGMEAPPY